MIRKESLTILIVLGFALLIHLLVAYFIQLEMYVAVLIAAPAGILVLFAFVRWLRNKGGQQQAVKIEIKEEDLKKPEDDEDFRLNRSEMTSWYQRLSQTYHFTLLGSIALLGFGISTYDKNISLFVYAVLFFLIASVSTGGLALIAWTYSVIMRQGSYLQVFYTDNWIKNSRESWDYHSKEPGPALHWVLMHKEPRYIAIALGGVIVTAGILLVERIIDKGACLSTTTYKELWALVIGSSLVWVSLAVAALWFIRLLSIKTHGKLWEQHWKLYYNKYNKKKA
ncbi:MAG: hypothetical protein HY787_08390 [Deltaproteobacteria bacterium]|nr:hypothetical protein [Deltaproteobacteria bacterium]